MNEASIRLENEMTLLKQINTDLRATIQQQAERIERLTAERDAAQSRYEKQCEGTMTRIRRIQSLEQNLAERDATIAELREWRRIVIGSGTDQETVVRMAAAEYTKTAVQCWKDHCAKIEQRAQRLREALQMIHEGIEGIECKPETLALYEAWSGSPESVDVHFYRWLAQRALSSPSPQGGDTPHRER